MYAQNWLFAPSASCTLFCIGKMIIFIQGVYAFGVTTPPPPPALLPPHPASVYSTPESTVNAYLVLPYDVTHIRSKSKFEVVHARVNKFGAPLLKLEISVKIKNKPGCIRREMFPVFVPANNSDKPGSIHPPPPPPPNLSANPVIRYLIFRAERQIGYYKGK